MYLPDQGQWNPAIITKFEFYVSMDNITWKLIDEGEFSNIKNNPLLQTRQFVSKNARYIKLKALKTTEENNDTGYAEFDVITK
jgi:alpha-L-fucosidase